MNVLPYQIERPAGQCAATGEPLRPGDRRVTVLVERDGSSTLGRLDFSERAWEAGARPDEPRAVFGSWRNVVPDPSKARQPVIDADGLMDLFEQLEGQEDRSRQVLRYLIALALMRKKLIVHEGAERVDGQGRALLVRPRGVAPPPERGGDGPPLVRVVEPAVTDQDLAEATAQLAPLIDADT